MFPATGIQIKRGLHYAASAAIKQQWVSLKVEVFQLVTMLIKQHDTWHLHWLLFQQSVNLALLTGFKKIKIWSGSRIQLKKINFEETQDNSPYLMKNELLSVQSTNILE